MDTENTIEITSLVEFLNWIKKSKQPDNNFVRFYRGQNINKYPTPSIFRHNINSDEESSMFYEVINRKPEEFSNCKCTFDYLVKMQHYDLPTRLLDITSNPLVALYFACEKTEEKSTPTIFTFDIPKELIKNYNSDSVTILSNLAKCNHSTKDKIIKQIKELNIISNLYLGFINKIVQENNISDFRILLRKNKELLVENFLEYKKLNNIDYKDFIYYYLYVNSEDSIIDCLKEIGKQIGGETINFAVYTVFSNIENSFLLHEIKQDKPYFQDIMKRGTFETAFCVNPKLDNPRIIAQSGSFLIFPQKIEEKEGLNSIKLNKIHIPLNKVDEIKKDLALLNIKEDVFFNELAKVCESVKNGYKI